MVEDTAPKATKVTPPRDAEDADGGKNKRTNSGKPKGRPLSLERELEEFFMQAGALVMMADQFDGLVIVNEAGNNATALAKLANKNARVKKALEALVNVSSLSAVVGVVGATAIPIAMHHGLIPPAMPMPSEWLEPPERTEFKKKVEAEMKAAQNGFGDGPING